jgi:hypothetical protein
MTWGYEKLWKRSGAVPRRAFVRKNAKIKTKSPRPLLGRTSVGEGVKSLRGSGSVTAWGLTHRFFLERRRFELFSRNQRNQTAERKTLAHKSSVLKALGSVPWASRSDRAQSDRFIFHTRSMGRGRSKVWNLQAWTAGQPRTYCREIPENLFLQRQGAHTLKKCREIQDGG